MQVPDVDFRLGEKINDKGVGNGISMLIFSGIVARFFPAVIQTFSMVSSAVRSTRAMTSSSFSPSKVSSR